MDNFFTLDRKGENNGGQVLWSKDQLTYLIEDYNKNHNTTKLSKEFNVSPECIRTTLRKNKIKVLNLSELHTIDYPRNSNYFDNIDTPDKAYWLGFFMADGYVTDKELGISLQEQDKNHLQKFLNAINATNHKISTTSYEKFGKTRTTVRISLKDRKMSEALKDKGCIEHKTYNLTFPSKEKLPEDLYSHFIRGFFDGDGSLHWTQSGRAKQPNYRLSFCSYSEEFLSEIRKILGKENLKIGKDTSDIGASYQLQISGNKQLKPILEFLYKDATDDILLSRKKKIYDSFLSRPIDGEPGNPGCE